MYLHAPGPNPITGLPCSDPFWWDHSREDFGLHEVSLPQVTIVHNIDNCMVSWERHSMSGVTVSVTELSAGPSGPEAKLETRAGRNGGESQ